MIELNDYKTNWFVVFVLSCYVIYFLLLGEVLMQTGLSLKSQREAVLCSD